MIGKRVARETITLSNDYKTQNIEGNQPNKSNATLLWDGSFCFLFTNSQVDVSFYGNLCPVPKLLSRKTLVIYQILFSKVFFQEWNNQII